jgi:beta-lactamase class A
VRLPVGQIVVRVRARGPGGARWSRARAITVLPRSVRRLGRLPGRLDRGLQRDLERLVSGMPAVAGVYVQNLRTNCGGAVNAGAQFPAASTLKVALLLEALRQSGGRPGAQGSALDRMIIDSDDRTANGVLVDLGAGSAEVGGARVTATLQRLGLRRSLVRRGYLLDSRRPIPTVATSRPALFTNFVTTPFDLSVLMVAVHRGAVGRGGIRRLGLSPTAARREALRRLLVTRDDTKLVAGAPARAAVAHKSGYTTEVKHDSGIVYLARGPIVVTAMTWSAGGVSDARGNAFIAEVTRAAVRRLRSGGRCG